MNVVTTLPAATELVAALGVTPVGVSHECDYPPAVADRPAVTRSRIDAGGSSEAIDDQVLAADAGDEAGLYEVDAATLEALEPDVVVTQGLCDVCAVDERSVERALESVAVDPDVVRIDAHSVADVFADLRSVGEALGRAGRAEAVIAGLESRIEAARSRTSTITPADRPRVAIFDWTAPVMIAGHWMPELVTAAGGAYGMADPAERSRPREWAEVLEYDPEVLVVAPCGFGLGQTAANMADLTEREGWDELTAVREGRAWAMDGDHYVNRPGPRVVDTLEYLAPICQPDRFERAPPAAVALPIDRLETLADRDDLDEVLEASDRPTRRV